MHLSSECQLLSLDYGSRLIITIVIVNVWYCDYEVDPQIKNLRNNFDSLGIIVNVWMYGIVTLRSTH